MVEETDGGVDGGGEPDLLHRVVVRGAQLRHGVGVADQLDDVTEEEGPEVVEALIRDQLARLGWLHVDHGQARNLSLRTEEGGVLHQQGGQQPSGEAVLEELLVRKSEVRS